MIRRFLTLTIIAAGIISCVAERTTKDDEPTDGKNEIGFATLLDSRAAAVTNTKKLADKGGFNVWAYTHATPWVSDPAKTQLLGNTAVTSNNDGVSWSYANPVLWPADLYVSFFAYGPAGKATPAGTDPNGRPVVNFTVDPATANQTDLLIAHPVYSQVGASYSGGADVGIRLEHALSRIVFSGMLTGEDTREITIKSIVIDGLYDSGSAALDASNIVWTIDGEPTASYTVEANTEEETVPEPTKKPELTSEILTTTSKFVTTDDGYLFLMPQSLVRDAGRGATMTVTLAIDGVAVEYPPTALFSPARWEPGKTYNYQIIVDGNDLRIVVIDMGASLDNWKINVYVNPVMLIPDANAHEKNEIKIDAAMKTLQLLSDQGCPVPSLYKSNYFAIYFSGIVSHDITVDMDLYDGFAEGDVVMLDAKKLVTIWEYDKEKYDAGGNGNDQKEWNFTLKVDYDSSKWELMDAMQPSPNPWSDPCYPEVDATSGPTTNDNSGHTKRADIQNKGSIILRKKETTP